MDFLKFINQIFLFVLSLLPLVRIPISLPNSLSKILSWNLQNIVKNSSEFAELILSIKLGKSKSRVSIDVVSLFTLVPLKTAKNIVVYGAGDDGTMGGRAILRVL